MRVTTDQLQTTNVHLGDGVTMLPPAPAPTPTPPAPVVGTVAKARGVTPVRKGTVRVKIACPGAAPAGCGGHVGLELAKGGTSLGKAKRYQVKAGRKATVAVRLSKKGLARLRVGRVVKVRVELTAPGSRKVLAKRTITVRRA